MVDNAAQPVPPDAPDRRTAWMTARWSTQCRACETTIQPGQWQALMDVPERGRSWTHEPCALALGAAPRPNDDEDVERGPRVAGPLRIVVIGSVAWPHDRAVEVRDGIEAVARGHREVVIVHSARRDPRGRLRGVDAWAALTATRLGYTAEPHDSVLDAADADPGAAAVDDLRALRPTVVVAFPLPGSAADSSWDDVAELTAAAELAGIPVLVHRPDDTADTTATS